MLHALREQGLSYSEIARRTGYERRSVTKWLKVKAPPDRRRATLNPASPYFPMLSLGAIARETDAA